MQELSPEEFGVSTPLLSSFDHSLAVQAVISRAAPGRILVDDRKDPSLALLMVRSHSYLSVRQANGAEGRLRFIRDSVLPAYRRETGLGTVSLHYPSSQLDRIIKEVFQERISFMGQRRYYERRADTGERAGSYPNDISLRSVDRDLVSADGLLNLDELKGEMCSERPSVQDFLDKSFGVGLVNAEELMGWCLSEYNLHDRCEVGIEVLEAYQRKGLGALLVSDFLRRASSFGIERVGWHCWAFNTASNTTALKAGFKHVLDYPSCVLKLD